MCRIVELDKIDHSNCPGVRILKDNAKLNTDAFDSGSWMQTWYIDIVLKISSILMIVLCTWVTLDVCASNTQNVQIKQAYLSQIKQM